MIFDVDLDSNFGYLPVSSSYGYVLWKSNSFTKEQLRKLHLLVRSCLLYKQAAIRQTLHINSDGQDTGECRVMKASSAHAWALRNPWES